jgi:hypothetical protein
MTFLAGHAEVSLAARTMAGARGGRPPDLQEPEGHREPGREHAGLVALEPFPALGFRSTRVARAGGGVRPGA